MSFAGGARAIWLAAARNAFTASQQVCLEGGKLAAVQAAVAGTAATGASRGLHTLHSASLNQSPQASACAVRLWRGLCQGQANAEVFKAPQHQQLALQILRGQRQNSTVSHIQTQLQDARRAGKRLLAAPQRAARSARNQVVKAGEGVYNLLPLQGQKMLDSLAKPGSTQKVLKLHLEAFWAAHGRKIIAVFGALAVYYLWRAMFGVTSVFLNLSETMAEFGFLALAAAMAAFTYLWLRRRWTINSDSVYRIALRRLNTDPGVLEVLGAPVAGSAVRASVSSGGGLRLRGLAPALRSRRLQMIFPLTGTDRRGLVSIEAKKRRGSYLFKLLAVDVPTASGAEQRLYLEGDASAYDRGGIMRELRDPFLNALALKDSYEEEDEVDDAADEAQQAQQEREALAAAVQPLQRSQAQGSARPAARSSQSGAYFSERASSAARSAWSRATALISSFTAPSQSNKQTSARIPVARPAPAASQPLTAPGDLPAGQSKVHAQDSSSTGGGASGRAAPLPAGRA